MIPKIKPKQSLHSTKHDLPGQNDSNLYLIYMEPFGDFCSVVPEKKWTVCKLAAPEIDHPPKEQTCFCLNIWASILSEKNI